MSNQGYSDQQSHGQGESLQSNNPYSHPQASDELPDYSANAPQQYQGGNAAPQFQSQSQHGSGYAAPPGAPPGQAPQRSETFRESDHIPESERGEQREAMQQFEMNKSGESQQDHDVAQLQSEFPSVDGSLIAALYGDSNDLGATRETLQELSSQTQ